MFANVILLNPLQLAFKNAPLNVKALFIFLGCDSDSCRTNLWKKKLKVVLRWPWDAHCCRRRCCSSRPGRRRRRRHPRVQHSMAKFKWHAASKPYPPPFLSFSWSLQLWVLPRGGRHPALRRRAGRHQNLLPRQKKKEFKKTTQPLISHTHSFDYIYIYIAVTVLTAPAGNPPLQRLGRRAAFCHTAAISVLLWDKLLPVQYLAQIEDFFLFWQKYAAVFEIEQDKEQTAWLSVERKILCW